MNGMAYDSISIKLLLKKGMLYSVCYLWKDMFIPYCVQYRVKTNEQKKLKTTAASSEVNIEGQKWTW